MCSTSGLRGLLEHFIAPRPGINPPNPARARPAGPARSGTFSAFFQNLEFSCANRAGSGATMALGAKLNKRSRGFNRWIVIPRQLTALGEGVI